MRSEEPYMATPRANLETCHQPGLNPGPDLQALTVDYVRGSDCQPLTITPKGSIINSCTVDYRTVYMYIMGTVVSHRLTGGLQSVSRGVGRRSGDGVRRSSAHRSCLGKESVRPSLSIPLPS